MRWLLFLLILSAPVSARDWFSPLHSGKQFVNPDLTPRRAHAARPSWQNQLVLWTGKLQHVRRAGAGWKMQLVTDSGTFPVVCPRPVLTLKPDPREGCTVALKANVQVQGHRISGLTGRSIILLQPPNPQPARTRLEFLTRWIQFHRPDQKPAFAASVAQSILENSARQGVDPLLLASLLQIESAYREDAISPSGAVGLGQLMPFTAEGLGVDPYDPAQNVAGACKMFGRLLQGWHSPLDSRALALASYNAGPSLVRQLQTIPQIPETNNYVYFIGFVHRYLSRLAPAR